MQQQLLQQLRDIHAPEAIGWWPLAFGWWILISLFFAAILCLTLYGYLRWKKNAYRRAAMGEAVQYFETFQSDQNNAAYLQNMTQLLRRAMLCIDDTGTSAQATGNKWTETLNDQVPIKLSKETLDALAFQVYQPNPDTNIPLVHQELLGWIRNHRQKAND